MSTEVVIAKGAGFCFGVARATEAVEKEIAAHVPGERIFTLGRLIHNETYTARLRGCGVEVIETGDIPRLCGEAREGAPVRVFVRAHGMTAETENLLRACAAGNPYFTYADCTCSFVKKIHRICAEQSALCRAARESRGQDDRFLLVLGSANHPEVIGFLSRFEGEKHVFSSAAELEALLTDADSRRRWAGMTPVMVAQTTHNLGEWELSKKFLKNLFTNSLIFDTICSVTESRQQEAAALARECDLIIVIGGRDSSNSAKLFSICKNICADTVWIERADELKNKIPLSRRKAGTRCKVGVVAGASTPRDIIEEVANNMSEQAQNENFAELLEESALKTIKTGDTVVGIVTAVSPGEIQLDLGTKVTGVIKLDQITDDPAAKLDQMFKIGDEVEAFVIRVSDVDGFATLSKKRVDSDKNWKKIEEAYETQENIEGKVILVNKGGVVALVNSNQVFIPAAHSGVPRDGDLNTLVGQTVSMKIIEIKENKKAKGSIRKVLQEQRNAREKAFWENIEEGKVYQGVVKSMTSYGAFVDLGGVDGMVHSSELSWKHIKSPADVVSIGDEITVFVKSFNAEKKRISLGYKTEATNPWYIFTHTYAIGDVAPVKIVSLMPFGAFAEIVDGVDGLIHISEIADHRIGKPADVLEIGQVVDAKILDIDSERQKVALSIRALLEEAREAEEAMPEQIPEDTVVYSDEE